jgi:predicted dehydrogenase
MLPVDRYARYARTHVVLNVGIHDIDLALWYLPGDVIRVTALERNVQGGGTPDVVWAILETDAGGIAVIELLWLVPERSGVFLESSTEVVGSRGIGIVRQPGDGLSLWLEDGPSLPDTTLMPTIAGSVGGALREELGYFARCVMTAVAPTWVTGEDGIRALDVALRVRDAARG